MDKKLLFTLPLAIVIFYLCAMNEQQASVVRPPLTLKWGASARQGDKSVMEDRYAVAIPLTPEKLDAFFGLYDGHVGFQAADYAMNHLHKTLQPLLSFQESNAQALIETFEQTEQEFKNHNEKSGTTASVAYIQRNAQGEDMVTFAWVGDSRVIMANKNDVITFVSTDHRPDNPAEAARTGGRLKRNNLTRSLGNIPTKNKLPGLLIATPETAIRPLAAGDTIILASDGLWDTPGIDNGIVMLAVSGIMDPQELEATWPGEIAFESGNSEELQAMAHRIRDLAYKMGSKDNIAVMVVRVEEEASTGADESAH